MSAGPQPDREGGASPTGVGADHDGAEPDQPDRPDRPDRPEGPDEPEEGGDSWGQFLRELPVLLVVAFGLAFLLRTFVVQVFYIPSESMAPTLAVNDRIIVEKISYRFGQPRRGEIVVFEDDSPPPSESNSTGGQILRGVGQFLGVVPANARDFVKRVIGLPGDRVVIQSGTVMVNGEPIEEPYVVNDGGESQGPFPVPPGKLFVLGDNRPNSSDSRFQLGYVDMDQLVGRAVLTIWPPDRLGTLGGASQIDVPAPAPTGSAAPSSAEQTPVAAPRGPPRPSLTSGPALTSSPSPGRGEEVPETMSEPTP